MPSPPLPETEFALDLESALLPFAALVVPSPVTRVSVFVLSSGPGVLPLAERIASSFALNSAALSEDTALVTGLPSLVVGFWFSLRVSKRSARAADCGPTGVPLELGVIASDCASCMVCLVLAFSDL